MPHETIHEVPFANVRVGDRLILDDGEHEVVRSERHNTITQIVQIRGHRPVECFPETTVAVKRQIES